MTHVSHIRSALSIGPPTYEQINTLELRITASLLEKGAKCRAKIDDRLLHSTFGNVEYPGELLALDTVELPP